MTIEGSLGVGKWIVTENCKKDARGLQSIRKWVRYAFNDSWSSAQQQNSKRRATGENSEGYVLLCS